jgi:cyclophilin family peptidyl-prolyl cis-trans isomerase
MGRISAASAAHSRSLSTAATASAEMESVILETNMGEIKLELYWNHAPRVRPTHLSANFVALSLARNQTCKNFAELAKRGYYNNVVFHRIIAVRHANAR